MNTEGQSKKAFRPCLRFSLYSLASTRSMDKRKPLQPHLLRRSHWKRKCTSQVPMMRYHSNKTGEDISL